MDAVKAVLGPLLRILDDLGPTEPDSADLRHPLWPDVARSAHAAAALLHQHDAEAATAERDVTAGEHRPQPSA